MPLKISNSLRTRLLILLSAAIVLTALAQALIAYQTARSEADEIFDYHMQQMAIMLGSGITLKGGSPEAQVQHDEEGFDFVVQAWTADGISVYRTHQSMLPQVGVSGFAEVTLDDGRYRVFATKVGGINVQVAQDLDARLEMARKLALRTVVPIVLIAPMLMLLVWVVVGASLKPVLLASRQVALRQADELEKLEEATLPDEIRPLVHELNLLFERVRKAFDAQQRFVADAAHELRSPLAALKLQLEGLKRSADTSTRDVAMGRLTSGIDRATRLVEQLLVLARHEEGIVNSMPRENLSLSEFTKQAVADVSVMARERSIDIGITTADEGSILVAKDALGILVGNVLSNAIKYTPDGGTVDVALVRTQGELQLKIEDSGPGIPSSERERVLDRFYRIAGASASGSGLGLSIVKSIVEFHGASLSLTDSEKLGGLKVCIAFRLES